MALNLPTLDGFDGELHPLRGIHPKAAWRKRGDVLERSGYHRRVSRQAISVLVLILVVGLGLFFLFVRPRMQLTELAVETCGQLDGAIMLQVGSILGGATRKAEHLGFTPQELGDEMREECPDLMAAMERWGREHSK
jgi:hypothetical protein